MSITVHHHPKGCGAVVDLHLRDTSWHGHYRFSTHGMTTEEIAAKRDAITEHHRLKSARHEGFNRMERMVDGFHVHGLAIVEQGADVRLVLRVTTPAETVLTLDRVVPSVTEIPSDSQIVTMVRDAATAWIGRNDAAGEHVANVKAALGLQ